jgi:hypothetical protein
MRQPQQPAQLDKIDQTLADTPGLVQGRMDMSRIGPIGPIFGEVKIDL